MLFHQRRDLRRRCSLQYDKLGHGSRPDTHFPKKKVQKKKCAERWIAKISYGSKQHHLGTFDTKEQAALAYDRAVRQCGENKPLNYESIAAAEEAAVQAQAAHTPTHPKPTPRPTSGFYGVYASGKRRHAQINYDGTTHSLGSFDTKHQAALAYDREARQRGEDKLLNYESAAAAEAAACRRPFFLLSRLGAPCQKRTGHSTASRRQQAQAGSHFYSDQFQTNKKKTQKQRLGKNTVAGD
jgi:hypothetical protein